MGSKPIQLSSAQVHLGIHCDSYLSAKNQLYNASVKLRSTFINITNNGLQAKHLNPMLLRTIYAYAVIPKALYECKSLTSCAAVDKLKRTRADRFCVKYFQEIFSTF